jgi:hypothetical protein
MHWFSTRIVPSSSCAVGTLAALVAVPWPVHFAALSSRKLQVGRLWPCELGGVHPRASTHIHVLTMLPAGV